MTTPEELVKQTWEEFEDQYKLVQKFGMNALQQQLDAQRKRQNLGGEITLSDVRNMLGLDDFVEKLELNLNKVQVLLQQAQTPRADIKPELTNRNILGQNPATQAPQQQFKNPPWAKKMDLAADPKISAAIQDIANTLNNRSADPNALTTQFENAMDKLKDQLRNEYKNRLNMKMAPSPGKKNKPEPF